MPIKYLIIRNKITKQTNKTHLNWPNSDGILWLKQFSDKNKDNNLSKFPNSVGMLPYKLLKSKYNNSNSTNIPKLVGIVPIIALTEISYTNNITWKRNIKRIKHAIIT